jgi:hypothetical protein
MPQFWSSLVAPARGVPRSQSCEREFLPCVVYRRPLTYSFGA